MQPPRPPGTATGLLAAYGNGRGRYYAAAEPLQRIGERLRAERKTLGDPYPYPYPWMRAKLAEPIE